MPEALDAIASRCILRLHRDALIATAFHANCIFALQPFEYTNIRMSSCFYCHPAFPNMEFEPGNSDDVEFGAIESNSRRSTNSACMLTYCEIFTYNYYNFFLVWGYADSTSKLYSLIENKNLISIVQNVSFNVPY